MNRTEALCRVLGWQGGTIHQVATETGCRVEHLLYGSVSDQTLTSDYTKGWFSARTCSLEWNRKTNFPKHKGNLAFWIGAAEGMILKMEGK